MDVAVIGTGDVGGSVGRALARDGHRVWFGSRQPQAGQAGGDGAGTVTTVAEAISHADVVVLAVPGPAVDGFAAEHGAKLAGKLVVDATNRLGGSGPAHSAQTFAEHAPAARYARAFNTLGYENFERPQFAGVTADLFFTSPDADRATVEALIRAVGLNPVHLGVDNHDTLDGLLWAWWTLAVDRGHSRHIAFKLLHH